MKRCFANNFIRKHLYIWLMPSWMCFSILKVLYRFHFHCGPFCLEKSLILAWNVLRGHLHGNEMVTEPQKEGMGLCWIINRDYERFPKRKTWIHCNRNRPHSRIPNSSSSCLLVTKNTDGDILEMRRGVRNPLVAEGPDFWYWKQKELSEFRKTTGCSVQFGKIQKM